jgi:DNA-binding response OmpR family regulator
MMNHFTYTIKKIVEDNGFKADSFNDPILALNYYNVNFYDLVILDIKMPTMDGFELYLNIREKDLKVKICFLTAITRFNEEFRKIRLALGKQSRKTTLFKSPSKWKTYLKN